MKDHNWFVDLLWLLFRLWVGGILRKRGLIRPRPARTRYSTEFVHGGPAMSPTIVEDDGRIVVNCPVCLRVKWFHTTCHHGQCPPPRDDDSDVHANPPRQGRVKPASEQYKEKNRDLHRPRPEYGGES